MSQTKFLPRRTGAGWTVIRREGSKRTGYRDHKTTAADGLTLHQAQATADAFGRDFTRHGLLPEHGAAE